MRFGPWLGMLWACASAPEAPVADLGPAALGRGLRCADHHCDVRRALADRIVRALREGRQSDLPRIVPSIDRRDGIKLYAIRPGSAFEGLGFRNGDVVRTVDGVPLVAARLRELLKPLAGRDRHTVEIERESSAVTLDFSIVD